MSFVHEKNRYIKNSTNNTADKGGEYTFQVCTLYMHVNVHACRIDTCNITIIIIMVLFVSYVLKSDVNELISRYCVHQILIATSPSLYNCYMCSFQVWFVNVCYL